VTDDWSPIPVIPETAAKSRTPTQTGVADNNAGASGLPIPVPRSSSKGLVAGIVIGVLLFVGLIAVLGFFLLRHRKPRFAPLLAGTDELYMQSVFGNEAPAPPIVVIGCPSVGKTSLINRIVGRKFTSITAPTTGAAVHTYTPLSPDLPEVQIWDTPGMDRYRSQAKAFYREAVGAIVVFDLTSYATFQELDSWIREFIAAAPPNPAIVICGNKADLQDEREVEADEVAAFCTSHDGAPYFEASAYTGRGIEELVTTLLMKLPKEGTVETTAQKKRR
jgi:Ras-related protein Rab-5C